MNICDFAMEMEDNGCEYYKSLASAATLPGLKTIFTDLAEDERKHFEIFRALKEGGQIPPMAESESLQTAQNVFSLLFKVQANLKFVVYGKCSHAVRVTN